MPDSHTDSHSHTDSDLDPDSDAIADAGGIALEPVTAANWRDCAALRVNPDQERFVAPVTYYLCLCTYGAEWQPRAITRDGVVVGFCMWGLDDDGSRWIGGLVVDVAAQRTGVARGAVLGLLAEFEAAPDFAGSALSYSPDNTAARSLYRALGFRETDEWIDDGAEVVARRGRGGVPDRGRDQPPVSG